MPFLGSGAKAFVGLTPIGGQPVMRLVLSEWVDLRSRPRLFMPGRASAEVVGPKPRAAQPTSCAVCGENLSRAGNVADGRIIGVRLVFGDVAHGIADLFERDANAATLLTYLR